MIAGSVRVALDELCENHRGFAGEDGVDRVPVGSIEFGKLQFLQNGACPAQRLDRRLKDVLLLGLGARPLCEAHDGEARRSQRLQALVDIDLESRDRPAVKIAVANACEQRQRQGDVVDASRKEPDMVERRTERVHPAARDRAKTRLESDHAIEGGGADDRAQRLRPQGERHDAGGDRSSGAGRRTARRMPAVPGIDGRSGMTPGELGRDRLAENRGAELAKLPDHPGVRCGHVIPVDRRAVGGRHVRGGDDVLDRHRNARQRSRLSCGIHGEIFECPQNRFDSARPFQPPGGVPVRGGLVDFEQAQQLQHPRAGVSGGAFARKRHVAIPPLGRRQTRSISIRASYARPVTPTQVRAGKRPSAK